MWERLSKWTMRVALGIGRMCVAKGGWKEEVQQSSDSHLFSGCVIAASPAHAEVYFIDFHCTGS